MSFKKFLKYSIALTAVSALGFCIYQFFNKYYATPLIADSNTIKLPPGVKANTVVVYKEQRKLQLISKGKVLKSYKISLGDNPQGHKQMEGDSKTPEGEYTLDWRNPNSKFHLSLHISYPNQNDREKAMQMGVSPGGDIMIHGYPNGMEWNSHFYDNNDWTDGCIAVSNPEIQEIWNAVPNGTPIHIFP